MPDRVEQGKRDMWETRYQQRDVSQFFWYKPEPPDELRRLMEGDNAPTEGAALDLGCGPGHLTIYLSRYLRPAVGVDIALAAVSKARDLAVAQGSRARFGVVEAPDLPFRSASFGLVFDRGCLQAIPRAAWPRYFSEVERILRPGGHLWLYCSTVAHPKAFSKRGLRQMAGRLTGKSEPASLSDTIVRHLPASLETLTLENREFRTPAGRDRLLVYGLFRRR